MMKELDFQNNSIRRAVYRAKFEIASMGLIYILYILVGAIMAHGGNQFALDYSAKAGRLDHI